MDLGSSRRLVQQEWEAGGRHPAEDAGAQLDARGRGEGVAVRRRGLELQRLSAGITEPELGDPIELVRQPATQRAQAIDEGRVAREQLADVGLGLESAGLPDQLLVLVGARQDPCIEAGQLLEELELLVAEGLPVLLVGDRQHPEAAVPVEQRGYDRTRRLPLPGDGEVARVRLSSQQDRALLGEGPAGDPLAGLQADLVQQLPLDPDGRAHAERLAPLVPQQQRSPVRARRAHGDLDDPLEQGIPVDREVVGLEDLSERLEQVGLARRIDGSEGVEQLCDQGARDLDATIARLGQPVLEDRRRVGSDDGDQAGGAQNGGEIVGDAIRVAHVEPGFDPAQALERGGRFGRHQRAHVDVRIRLQQRDQGQTFVGVTRDRDALAHVATA